MCMRGCVRMCGNAKTMIVYCFRWMDDQHSLTKTVRNASICHKRVVVLVSVCVSAYVHSRCRQSTADDIGCWLVNCHLSLYDMEDDTFSPIDNGVVLTYRENYNWILKLSTHRIDWNQNRKGNHEAFQLSNIVSKWDFFQNINVTIFQRMFQWNGAYHLTLLNFFFQYSVGLILSIIALWKIWYEVRLHWYSGLVGQS